MLTAFEVKNFKSIKSLRLPMQQFMALVGPNGAGKTNVVAAMELTGSLLSRGTTDPARREWAQMIRRGKQPARGGLTLGATLPFQDNLSYTRTTLGNEFMRALGAVQLSFRLTLSGARDADDVQVVREEVSIRSSSGLFHAHTDQDRVKVEPGADPNLWHLVSPHVSDIVAKRRKKSATADTITGAFTEFFNQRSLEQDKKRRVLRLLNLQRFFSPWMSDIVSECQIMRLRLDASSLRSDSFIHDVPGESVLGPTGEGLAAAVMRLRENDDKAGSRFQRVLASLQKVYPRIEDVRAHRILSSRLTLLFKERGITEELGQSNVSDGVLHALALLVVLEGRAEQTGVLAIEEPENAIHPWPVRSMIERAQEAKRQVIVTTHSETVVNAVHDPGSLWIVENDDKKGTTVSAARDHETALDAILRETGQKLGDLWMDGSLGGVPRSQP
jgi:predicted ATPase